VTALGSVFVEPAKGPRGEDLHARVEVARRALGDSEGVVVALPSELPCTDGMTRWTPREGDPDGGVRLQLSPSFPSGGVVRLRGQGAVVAGGVAPGDLLIEVCLSDDAGSALGARPSQLAWVVLAVSAAILAGILL